MLQVSSTIIVVASLLSNALLANDVSALKALPERSDELVLDIEKFSSTQAPCAYRFLLSGAFEHEEFDLVICDATLAILDRLNCYARDGRLYNTESGSEVAVVLKQHLLGEPIHFILTSKSRKCAAAAFVVPAPLEIKNHLGYKLSALLTSVEPAIFQITGSGFAPEEVVLVVFMSGPQYQREALTASINGEVSVDMSPDNAEQSNGYWSVQLWGRKGSICLRGSWGNALRQPRDIYYLLSAYLKERPVQ